VGGKGRFDLDAQQAAICLNYEVVRFAVSVGLAYCESEAGRFDYEYEFHQFAFTFGAAVHGRGRPAGRVARLSGSDLRFFRHRTGCWRFFWRTALLDFEFEVCWERVRGQKCRAKTKSAGWRPALLILTLLLEYQVEGGKYAMFSNFIFGLQ
jgi:hypothetical protein